MKTLFKILSDNRKFITAFVGLYIAYIIGFAQGSGDGGFSLVNGAKEFSSGVTSSAVSQVVPDPTAYTVLVSPSPSSTSATEETGSVDAFAKEDKDEEDKEANLEVSSNETKKPSPSPAVVPSNSKSVSPKMIDASGKYNYMGQDITYTLSFKDNGGQVSGSVGGVCTGDIDGVYDGNDGGVVEGTIKGSCGMGFFSKKLDSTYTGNVYLQKGVVNITLRGEIPFVSGEQSFSLSFTP